MKNSYVFKGLCAALLFAGCTATRTPGAYTGFTAHQYTVNNNQKDSAVARFLQPYTQQVHQTMNVVIGEAGSLLEKHSPEGSLGNFLADAMLTQAQKAFAQPVDIALVNDGGIRIANVAKGPITIGKIYEIMPFDNLIVLQQLTGAQLQQFLDAVAARGGWPVAGLTMQIKDRKAVHVLIGGKPLDTGATYTMANSDYVANGGDDMAMLRQYPQINKGIVYREAIINHIKELSAQGKKVHSSVENRVSYAK